MRNIFISIILLLISSSANSETNYFQDDYFYIGKMDSYNKDFTLYFKTRQKSVLAKGENYNYITDYPQDLYIYNNKTKTEKPLISYEWFPNSAKQILRNYNFPVFPEDFAYYLLNDNNTLVLVSAAKNYSQNLKFDIKNKELTVQKNYGKLNFIISTFTKNCGYKSIKNNFECNIYKPLISKNLIN